MADLHPALIPSLDLLPAGPVSLVTRHSVREMNSHGPASYDLPLTPEGVALAERWGGLLRRPISRLCSSPVGRCVDTALALARGAGQPALEVVQTRQLVEPGCYVEHMREVGPLFQSLGAVSFANRHFALPPLQGILTPQAGAARLLQHLREHEGEPGSLSVHVTHDTILAAFIYHLIGQAELLDEDWPWMLEGAWLWFDAGQVHWLWRGRHGQRALAPYLDGPDPGA